MPDLNISHKTAHERLFHVNPKTGKVQPLCLACGKEATNDLPSCNEPKCVASVRPVARWSKQVVNRVTA